MTENTEFDFTGLYEGECGYFENRKNHEEIYLLPENDEDAKNIVGDLPFPLLSAFDFFLSEGFRRSGNMIYRATCPDCKKCIPIRIIPEKFEFNKKQRYLLKKNSDITLTISFEAEALVNPEKVNLMMQYNKRHEPDNTESYAEVENILLHMNGLIDVEENRLAAPLYPGIINMDYRLNGKLVGVGIIDTGAISLSSNYFYYDISDDIMKRSIGTFTILKEIEFCKKNNIPLYYLGYYLSECRKMNYKGKFLPHELLIDGEWVEQKQQNFSV